MWCPRADSGPHLGCMPTTPAAVWQRRNCQPGRGHESLARLYWSRDLRDIRKKNTITNKCNSKLGFLRRNLSRCPQKLKETAYLSLVRPILEYDASVWDPHLIKDRNSLEAVQRNAARFVYGEYRRGLAPHIYG